jgi:putative cell wall-binding protein
MGRRLFPKAALVAALCLLMMPARAHGGTVWDSKFFEAGAAGQAIYENMVIHPQAIKVGSTTYAVYQGRGMDPYIAAFSADGSMKGPYRIGANPLGKSADPDDCHGAPAILYDAKTNRLHVFWGAHESPLMHGTARPSNLSAWSVKAEKLGAVSYPQVFADSKGVAHLFYRTSGPKNAIDTRSALGAAWRHAVSLDGGATWTSQKPVLWTSKSTSWYVHFEPGANDTVHMVATTHQASARLPGGAIDQLARTGVYYARLDPADGRWKDAAGTPLGTAGRGLTFADVTAPGKASALPVGPGRNQNSVTAADDGSGHAGVLFLSGEQFGTDALNWVFARYDGSRWVTSTIAPADHLFESGTLEFADGGIDAYLTVGRDLGYTPVDTFEYRGGDLVHFRSTDDGASWQLVATVAESAPEIGVLYNDPQLVVGHGGTGPRLLYGEWDNDDTAGAHKEYLWGPEGLRGKAFTTQVSRYGATTRWDTATQLSKEAWRNGSDYVVVASGEKYADALSAAPLAAAYHAPLLLVAGRSVPACVKNEIARLKAKQVVIVGGPGSVSEKVRVALRRGTVTGVRRISGADRYAVAAAVAREVVARTGRRGLAFIASGESFPDAILASSIAGAQGVPVLLAKAGAIPRPTLDALSSLGVTRTVVVGESDRIGDEAIAALPSPVRIAGPDRYSTASALAVLGLDGIRGLVPRSLRTDRVVVASGAAFPDALAGAAVAARLRAPLLLARPGGIPAATSDVIRQRVSPVLQCLVLGGKGSISAVTMTRLRDLF